MINGLERALACDLRILVIPPVFFLAAAGVRAAAFKRGKKKKNTDEIIPTKLINAPPQSLHLTILWLSLRKQLQVVVVVDERRYKARQNGTLACRQAPGAAA